jgi:hypothetical protein
MYTAIWVCLTRSKVILRVSILHRISLTQKAFNLSIELVSQDFIRFVKQMFQLDIEAAHIKGLETAMKRLAIRFQHQCSIFVPLNLPTKKFLNGNFSF